MRRSIHQWAVERTCVESWGHPTLCLNGSCNIACQWTVGLLFFPAFFLSFFPFFFPSVYRSSSVPWRVSCPDGAVSVCVQSRAALPLPATGKRNSAIFGGNSGHSLHSQTIPYQSCCQRMRKNCCIKWLLGVFCDGLQWLRPLRRDTDPYSWPQQRSKLKLHFSFLNASGLKYSQAPPPPIPLYRPILMITYDPFFDLLFSSLFFFFFFLIVKR